MLHLVIFGLYVQKYRYKTRAVKTFQFWIGRGSLKSEANGKAQSGIQIWVEYTCACVTYI